MIRHKETFDESNSRTYAPWVTPEMFAGLTGLSLDAVKNAVQLRKLPVVNRNEGRRGRAYINMVALERFAFEQADEYQDWKNSF